MNELETTSGDSGRGWRSPRVALVKDEHDQAIASRRSCRAFLKGVGVGSMVLGIGAASAMGGAVLSAEGRLAMAGLFETLTPDGFLDGKPIATADASAADQNEGLGIADSTASVMPTPLAPLPNLNIAGTEELNADAMNGAPISAPITNPDGIEGQGQHEASIEGSDPATGEAGFGDEVDVETGIGADGVVEGSGTGTGKPGPASSGRETSGSETGELSDAESTDDGRSADHVGESTESTPGGVLDPFATPTVVPAADPRRVNPYGSDSTAPKSSNDTSVISPRIPNYNLPVNARLIIRTIGVEAPVIPLGIDAQGRMLAPDGPHDVGWFELGPLPGTAGNAILTGHVDWTDGSLGVFSSLHALQPGPIVQFANPEKGFADYLVKWQRKYLAAQAPINEIVGQNMNERELTLITCAGTFDRQERNYSHRLIVRCGMK